MKLRRLTIHNIASIEDATIDFDAQPLENADVFLISGATGAGKTTILDSICLALYDNVPRMAGSSLKSLFDTNSDSNVKVCDPRQLLRKGATEGSVELTFTARDGRDYTAVWSVSRTRLRQNGKLKPSERQLISDVTGPLTKKKEIDAAVSAAVGLDFEQFCRTTILAQGEFTRFLNSSDYDKSVILEKLTGESVYAQVGAKVHETTMDCKHRLEQLEARLNATHVMTDEELALAQERRMATDIEASSVKQQISLLRSKAEWLKTESSLKVQIEETARQIKMISETMAGNDYNSRVSLIHEWTQTGQARHMLATIDNIEKSIVEVKAGIAENRIAFGKIRHRIRLVADTSKETEHKIADSRTAIQQYGDALKAFADSSEIIGLLQHAISLQTDMETTRSIINRKKLQLTSGLKELSHKQETLSDKKSEIETLTSQLREINSKRTEVDVTSLDRNRRSLTAKLSQLTLLKADIERASEHRRLIGIYTERLGKLLHEIEKISLQAAISEKNAINANNRAERDRSIFESLKDAGEKWATAARAALTPGCECPVCRQRVNQLPPSDEILHESICRAREQMELSRKEAEDATNATSRLRGDANGLERAKDEIITTMAAEQKSLDIVTCRINGNALFHSYPSPDSITLSITKTEQEIAVIDTAIADFNNLGNNALSIQKHLDALNDFISRHEKEIAEQSEQVNTLKGELNSLTLHAVDSGNKFKEIIRQLNVHDGTTRWNKLPPDQFLQSFKTDLDTYNGIVKNNESLTVALSQINEKLISLNNSEAELTEVLGNIQPEVETAASQNDIETDIRRICASATSNRSRLEQLNRLHSEVSGSLSLFCEKTSIDLNRIKELAEISAETIEKERDRIKKTENLRSALEGSLHNLNNQLSSLNRNRMEIKPDDNPDSVDREIALAESHLHELTLALGAIDESIATDARRRNDTDSLRANIRKARDEYSMWHRLNSLVGSAKGEKFRAIAQSFVLQNLLDTANGYLERLSDRYRLVGVPGEYTIAIEDAYENYIRRPALTTSGGESFMISLALALALSDTGDRLAVDTLFIDEGFGSLSGEPLRRAVNLLRTLHQHSGRRVGIISHIDELKAEIPVKIIVTQIPGRGSSSVHTVSAH